MNTLTPGQIPSACEIALIRMPAEKVIRCQGTPVVATLEGRLYQCEDEDLVPITLYICAACVVKYTPHPHSYITPLTEYEFESTMTTR